jgi:hypothetical protein
VEQFSGHRERRNQAAARTASAVAALLHLRRSGRVVGEVHRGSSNLETQKQIQFSIVGPAFYEFRPDGSFTVTGGTGPWGWFPENPETGEPGIFYIRGRLTYTVDADGNFSFDLIAGQIINVCPRLA